LKREEPKNASSFHTLKEKDSSVAFELILWFSRLEKKFVEF
jgi:hypothetical protein